MPFFTTSTAHYIQQEHFAFYDLKLNDIGNIVTWAYGEVDE